MSDSGRTMSDYLRCIKCNNRVDDGAYEIPDLWFWVCSKCLPEGFRERWCKPTAWKKGPPPYDFDKVILVRVNTPDPTPMQPIVVQVSGHWLYAAWRTFNRTEVVEWCEVPE